MSAKTSFKTELEETLKKSGQPPPKYTTYDVYMGWESSVEVNGKTFSAKQTGGTKRSIEEKVAEAAYYSLISPDTDDGTGDKTESSASMLVFDSALFKHAEQFLSGRKSSTYTKILGSTYENWAMSESVDSIPKHPEWVEVSSDELWYTYLVMIIVEVILKHNADSILVVSNRKNLEDVTRAVRNRYLNVHISFVAIC